MYFFLVAGPRHVLLARLQRRADGMHAGHHPPVALVDEPEDRPADARHDAHVDDDVGRIGDFDADPRHGRVDRTHAEGQHVHRAALHAAAEEVAQGLLHLEGIRPVVGRAGAVLGEAANERAVFDAGDVARVGAGEIAAGPVLLVEPDERAARDQLPAQRVVLLRRTVDPVDAVGFAQGHHLVDPRDEMRIRAEWFSRISRFHGRGGTVGSVRGLVNRKATGPLGESIICP